MSSKHYQTPLGIIMQSLKSIKKKLAYLINNMTMDLSLSWGSFAINDKREVLLSKLENLDLSL